MANKQQQPRRAIPPARPPVPWELEAFPRGLRNQPVVVGGEQRLVYLVRAPDDGDELQPRQAYERVRNADLPPVGAPGQRETVVCVILPRDDNFPDEVVFREPDEDERQLVVVKRIHQVPQHGGLPGTERDPRVEVAAMKFLNNTENQNNHTMPCNEALEDENNIYIVMPFNEGGDLFDYMMNHNLTEQQVRDIFELMVASLAHHQDRHVCHRDVKGENILVDMNATQTTVIDFATSLRVPRSGDQQDHHLMPGRGRWGTTIYMAPEIWCNDKMFDGFAADIWSLGVVLFVMLTGQGLYNIPSQLDNGYVFWIVNGGLGTAANMQQFDQEVRTLLAGMLNPIVAQRFTLEQVQAHLDAW